MDARCSDESVRHGERETAEMATRPGYGKAGDAIAVATSFVELGKTASSDILIARYHVNVTANSAKLSVEDKQNAFWALVRLYRNIFNDPFNLAYDGQSLLLINHNSTNVEFECLEGEVCVRLNDTGHPIGTSIEIKRGDLMKLAFKSHLNQSLAPKETEKAIEMVNIILSQDRLCPLTAKPESFCIVDGTAFEANSEVKVALEHGTEAWRGLFMEAKVTDGYRPLVNVDLMLETFYRPQTLLQYICDVLNGHQQKQNYAMEQMQTNTALTDTEWRIIKPALIGLHVSTLYRDIGSRYPIIDAVPQAAAQKIFTHDGQKISVADYFREKYGMRYPYMPAVQVGSKSQSVYLPIEVCAVPKKLRYDASKLLHAQKKQLNQCRQINPLGRLAHCMDLMRKLVLQNDKFLSSFGLSLSQYFVQAPGRVLPAPAMEYKCKRRPVLIHPVDGIWQIRDKHLLRAASCYNCVAVSFLHRCRLYKVMQFCRNVAIACNKLGMHVATKVDMLLPVTTAKDLEWAFDLITSVYKQRGMTCGLIFVVVNCAHQYAAVKFLADVKYGVRTCCVKPDAFANVVNKRASTTATDLALKVNLILGGVNTRITEDCLTKTVLSGKSLLVLAAGTLPLDSGKKASPLIRVMVGNTDADCAKYEATVNADLYAGERTFLEHQFRARMLSYRSSAARNPSRVVLFLAHVPEGKLKLELQCNLEAFKSACHSIGKDYEPNLTIVVVSLEHHTHFVLNDKKVIQEAATGRMLPIGTVVDRCIVSADNFDYYVHSNAETEGAKKPTKYHVIYDENKQDADAIQTLCYHLCYLSGCSTCSISMPGPVHFAYLACKRARQHLQHALEGEDTTITQGEYIWPTIEELNSAITVHENIRKTMYFV